MFSKNTIKLPGIRLYALVYKYSLMNTLQTWKNHGDWRQQRPWKQIQPKTELCTYHTAKWLSLFFSSWNINTVPYYLSTSLESELSLCIWILEMNITRKVSQRYLMSRSQCTWGFVILRWDEKRGYSRGWGISGTHPADKFSLLSVVFIGIIRTILTTNQPVIYLSTHSNNFNMETTRYLMKKEYKWYVCQRAVTNPSLFR